MRRTLGKTLVELQTMTSNAVLRVRDRRHIRSFWIHGWRFEFLHNGGRFPLLRTKPLRFTGCRWPMAIAASKLHLPVRTCQVGLQMHSVIELYRAGIDAALTHRCEFRVAGIESINILCVTGGRAGCV